MKRRPGASPLLFGHFLMDSAAFLSLEDIAEKPPPYEEEVISVEMDPALKEATRNSKKISTTRFGNFEGTLLYLALACMRCDCTRPTFQMGDLMGSVVNPESGERETILISSPADLDREVLYAKERRLIDEVKAELERGRKCQLCGI